MAAYIAAAVIGLAYLRASDGNLLARAKHAAGVANTLLLVVFVTRWVKWDLVPMTGLADSLNVFLILATGIVLTVQLNKSAAPLLSFCLPPLAIIAGVNLLAGFPDLSNPPKELAGLPLTIHVGLVFLAFALFYVASMISVAYAVQAQNLKRNRTTGLSRKLPSLEQLDKFLYRLIGIGYPVFVVTLVFGLVWARLDRELLGDSWWISPKIFLSAFMVLIYAVSFHSRWFGLLRGPKLAYLVFVSFALLMTTYLVLGVLGLSNYNFFEASV